LITKVSCVGHVFELISGTDVIKRYRARTLGADLNSFTMPVPRGSWWRVEKKVDKEEFVKVGVRWISLE